MHTHGGGDIKDENGELTGLKGTLGCFRMSDEDIIELKIIIDVLEETISSERMTILIFEDDIKEPISEDDFVEAHKDATISNGTVLLPEVIVLPQDDKDDEK